MKPTVGLASAEDDAAPTGRSLAEALVPATLLALQVAFTPLGSLHFPAVAAAGGALAVSYAVFGLCRLPGAARRWGLIPPRWADDHDFVRGCVVVGSLFAAGVVPILAVKMLDVPLPTPVGGAWVYLGWCVVQDFVFFSLILRGLADLIHPVAAVPIAAGLFALSHSPHPEMMGLTALVAVAWGYLFLASRWLPFVLASHWVMGVLLLM
jgi:hypothetical protein